MCETNQEETLKTEHLVSALNRYGASDVLSLLVRFSDRDWAVRQLLIRFPSIVSISHFMFNKPLFKINGLSSKEFFNTNCPIRVMEKKGQNQKGEIGEKASTQKKRNRKRSQKSLTEGRKELPEKAGDKMDDPPDRAGDVMGEITDDMKLDLGFSLLDRGEFQAGFILFSSLPWNSNAEAKCGGMGRALTEMGRYDEAKRILEYGLKKFPQSYALWTDMGILFDGLEEYSETLKCFEVALTITRGENPGCLYNKALILIKLGSCRDAMSIIDHLTERYPEEPKYLAEGGCCLREMGYAKESLQYFQKAMELYERFPSVDAGVSIYTGLCSSYLDLGMKKEAMQIALEGLTKFPDEDPILYHNVGATFYEMGWVGEAKDVLQKGVEKFPNDLELRQFLNDLEQDFDDPDGDIKPLLGLLLLILLRKKSKKKP